jgi:hypothetical protein
MAGLPVAFTSDFYDDVNKKRQWTAFCAKNKPYVEKAEYKAVMEAIRNFLALPVRTVQEGHSFTKPLAYIFLALDTSGLQLIDAQTSDDGDQKMPAESEYHRRRPAASG